MGPDSRTLVAWRLRGEVLILVLPPFQTDSAPGMKSLGYENRHETESVRQAYPEIEMTQVFKWLILKNISRLTNLSSANNRHRQ